MAVEGGGVPKSFSVAQRAGALLLPMPKLFVIGFGATLAGYGLIAGLETLTAMRNHSQLASSGGAGGGGGRSAKAKGASTRKSRKAQARALAEEKPPVPVLGSGLAVGFFLAVWTNFRYQVRFVLVLALQEERYIRFMDGTTTVLRNFSVWR